MADFHGCCDEIWTVSYEYVNTFVPVEHENTPPGEVSVHRGAKVEATDGHLGQVDELLINSNNMHITHLILRERHVLKQREVAIPISQIDHADEDTVYLKLDKKSVEELPTIEKAIEWLIANET